jgi:hypothetical protein
MIKYLEPRQVHASSCSGLLSPRSIMILASVRFLPSFLLNTSVPIPVNSNNHAIFHFLLPFYLQPMLLFGHFGNIAGSAKCHISATTFQLLKLKITNRRAFLPVTLILLGGLGVRISFGENHIRCSLYIHPYNLLYKK